MTIVRKIMAVLLLLVAVANIVHVDEFLNEVGPDVPDSALITSKASCASHHGTQPSSGAPHQQHHCHLGHCTFFVSDVYTVKQVDVATSSALQPTPSIGNLRDPVSGLIDPPIA